MIGCFQWRVLIGCRLIHKGQQLNGNSKVISRNLVVHEMTQNWKSHLNQQTAFGKIHNLTYFINKSGKTSSFFIFIYEYREYGVYYEIFGSFRRYIICSFVQEILLEVEHSVRIQTIHSTVSTHMCVTCANIDFFFIIILLDIQTY